MGLFGKKASEPQVIDLRVAEPAPIKLEFGLPTPCPECGDPGYLDHIDPFKRIMYQHCPSCFARWDTTEEQLVSQG